MLQTLFTILALGLWDYTKIPNPMHNNTQPITITVGKEVFDATLYDNPTAQSLVKQMPFTVTLEDYAQTEKIFQPQTPLSQEGAPQGADPSVGDIMCYGPWGNVAIFYKDFRYADGLIPMGHLADVAGLVKALEQHPEATFALK